MGKSKRVRLSDETARSVGVELNNSKRYRLSKEQYDRYLQLKGIDGKFNETKANIWDEKENSGYYEYKGTRSLRNLDDALRYCKVDLNVWEVERHVFNSWDVSMKPEKGGTPLVSTNYQVKIWFRRIEKVEVATPTDRVIKIKPSDDIQMIPVIGCVHRPFHDKRLWDSFIAFLSDNKDRIKHFVIAGDYLDLRSLSAHEEWQPEGIDLGFEYSDGAQGINDIDKVLNKGTEKHYIYGNHEDRFLRNKKDLRRFGSALPSPEEAMGLKGRGWNVINDWKDGVVTIGEDTDVYHGHILGANATMKALKSIPDRNHVFFHTHAKSQANYGNKQAYNGGCMIDFNSDVFKYAPRDRSYKWSHGLVNNYVTSDNQVYTSIIDVKDSRIIFEGKVY